MPTYEFRCPDGTVIERVFKMSDVPNEIPLPDGSGVATRMISGGAGLLFKGTGFYITDYGKDGKKDQRAASESKGAADSKGSDAKSSDAKSSDARSSDAAPASAKAETKSDTKAASSTSAPASTPSTPKSE